MGSCEQRRDAQTIEQLVQRGSGEEGMTSYRYLMSQMGKGPEITTLLAERAMRRMERPGVDISLELAVATEMQRAIDNALADDIAREACARRHSLEVAGEMRNEIDRLRSALFRLEMSPKVVVKNSSSPSGAEFIHLRSAVEQLGERLAHIEERVHDVEKDYDLEPVDDGEAGTVGPRDVDTAMLRELLGKVDTLIDGKEDDSPPWPQWLWYLIEKCEQRGWDGVTMHETTFGPDAGFLVKIHAE